MSTNVIFMGWDRSIPGREAESAAHFQEFMQYLAGLQQAGAIGSFEAVLLNPHGGDLNGFVLIRGDNDQLNALSSDEDWITHITRGGMHLEGLGIVRGTTGELLMEQMGLWTKLTSK